jgi:hypothetical protein
VAKREGTLFICVFLQERRSRGSAL